MSPDLDRRRALTALGTVSLGALLAACGSGTNDGDAGGAPSSTAPPTTDAPPTGDSPTTDAASTVASGALAARFDESTTCTLTPSMTEGPYYFDVDAIRRDIREDREGAVLRLGVRVRDAASCTPLADAVVDVWHCDAVGNYSGFEAASQGAPSGGGRTDDETYLRGAQVTDADGIVEFVTVYPGWYRGRTTHIHAKVHLDRSTLLTTQFYFDDEFTAGVYRREPYASDTGRDTFNGNDVIYRQETELTLHEDGDGYLGLITIDVDR